MALMKQPGLVMGESFLAFIIFTLVWHVVPVDMIYMAFQVCLPGKCGITPSLAACKLLPFLMLFFMFIQTTAGFILIATLMAVKSVTMGAINMS
jgi:hypothetical protein